MPSCGIKKNCVLQKAKLKTLTELIQCKNKIRNNFQNCITRKINLEIVPMTEASTSCSQKSYFSITVSTNLIFIHTINKISMTNVLSEKDRICFCCWFLRYFSFT